MCILCNYLRTGTLLNFFSCVGIYWYIVIELHVVMEIYVVWPLAVMTEHCFPTSNQAKIWHVAFHVIRSEFIHVHELFSLTKHRTNQNEIWHVVLCIWESFINHLWVGGRKSIQLIYNAKNHSFLNLECCLCVHITCFNSLCPMVCQGKVPFTPFYGLKQTEVSGIGHI